MFKWNFLRGGIAMKKVVTLVLIVLSALQSGVAYAQYRTTFVSASGIAYGINEKDELWVISNYLDGHQSVNHYYSGDVVIPDSVSNPLDFYGRNKAVIGIKVSPSCFSAVTSLTLPNTIRAIEGIEGCAIETIDLPPLLTSLPNLSGCPNLKELIIPPTIKTVGACLNNCPSLTHVHLGAGVCSLDRDAFAGSDALTSITIDEANNCFSIVDDILYSKDQTHLWSYLPSYKKEVCNIPNTVTYIGSGAFKGCESLREITIPDGVEYLWLDVFRDCVNLRKVTLPESISAISGYAFLGCRSLEEVNIPSSVEEIGVSAFGNCASLTRLELPNHLTEILWRTFSGCENLETINIPESIKTIRQSAFANCKKLSKVVLPELVAEVEDSTFYNCSGLSELTVKGKISSVGEYAFAYCSSLKKLNLENFVGDIERYAFVGLGVDTLEIPESITRCTASAFSLSDSLTVANIKDTNKSINISGKLFSGCNNLRSLYLGRPIENGGFSDLPALAELTAGSLFYDFSNISLSECGNLKTITCLSTTPPKAQMATFSYLTVLGGVLRVPESAEEAYRSTLPWSAFSNIETFPDIVPTELRFNESNELEMRPSETLSLSVTVYPERANFARLMWTSSNEEVATVSEVGFVRSNKEGETDITVSTIDGALSATCHVSVRYVDAVEGVSSESIILYPNPVNDLLHIEGVASGAPVALYDMTGLLVLSTRVYEGVATLDVSGLRRGVYLCRIHDRTYKIVKR